MRLSIAYSLAIIGVIAAVTLCTRAAPFLLWGKNRRTPGYILYLGRALPPAVMAMLIVYCLKNVHPAAYPFGLPELLSVAAVVGLHLWRRNSLLSILCGTGLYMLLVQRVFIG